MFAGTPRKSSLFLNRATPLASGIGGAGITSTGKRKREDPSLLQFQSFEETDIFCSDVCGKLPTNVLRCKYEPNLDQAPQKIYTLGAIQHSGWSAISSGKGEVVVWEQGVTARGAHAAEPVSTLLRTGVTDGQQDDKGASHLVAIGEGRRGMGRAGGQSVLAAAPSGQLSFWADHRAPGTVVALSIPLQADEALTCCKCLQGLGFFVGSSLGKIWRVVTEPDLMARQLRKASGILQNVGRMLGYSDSALGCVRSILPALPLEGEAQEGIMLVAAVGYLGLEVFSFRQNGAESFVGSAEFGDSLPEKAELVDAALVQGCLVTLIGITSPNSESEQGCEVTFCLCTHDIAFSLKNGVSLVQNAHILLPGFSTSLEDEKAGSELIESVEMELVMNEDAEIFSAWQGPSSVHVVWANKDPNSSATLVAAVPLETTHAMGMPVVWEVSGRGRCLGAGAATHRHGCLLLTVTAGGHGYLLATWSKEVHNYVEAGGGHGRDLAEDVVLTSTEDLIVDLAGGLENAKGLSEALVEAFQTSEGSGGASLSAGQLEKRLAHITSWLKAEPNAKVLLSEAVVIAAKNLADARPAAGQLVHYALQTKMTQHLAFIGWLQRAGLLSARKLGSNSTAVIRLAGLGEKLAGASALALLQANMGAKGQGGTLQQALVACMGERGYSAARLANSDLTAAELFYGEPSRVEQLLPWFGDTVEKLVGTENLRLEALVEAARASAELLTGALEHRKQEAGFYNCPQTPCPWTASSLVRDYINSQMKEYVAVLQESPFPSSVATALGPCIDSLARVLLQGFEDEARIKGTKDGSALPNDRKREYQKSKDMVLLAVRLSGRREVAFQMAKQYLHFESLMELCDEMYSEGGGTHENLLRLLHTFNNVRGTHDETFPIFCLKWFESKQRPYDLLEVGSKIPGCLGSFLQTRPHLLWIHFLQTKQYGPAAATLLSQAKKEHDRLEMKRLSASLGKLCAKASNNKMLVKTIGDELDNELILAQSLDRLHLLTETPFKPIIGIESMLQKCIEIISQPVVENVVQKPQLTAALIGCDVIRVSNRRTETKETSDKECLTETKTSAYIVKLLGNIAYLDKDHFENINRNLTEISTSEWCLEENIRRTNSFQMLYEQYSKHPEFAGKVFNKENLLAEAADIAGSSGIIKSQLERCFQLVKDSCPKT